MPDDGVKTEGLYEMGTFAFLRSGWWILHIISVLAVLYLGWAVGSMIFK